uniref:Uncharacterized protein n=1 Tax=Arundo donax TaxID=35708 RepID=A0A0A9AGU7_ARUDO
MYFQFKLIVHCNFPSCPASEPLHSNLVTCTRSINS